MGSGPGSTRGHVSRATDSRGSVTRVRSGRAGRLGWERTGLLDSRENRTREGVPTVVTGGSPGPRNRGVPVTNLASEDNRSLDQRSEKKTTKGSLQSVRKVSYEIGVCDRP